MIKRLKKILSNQKTKRLKNDLKKSLIENDLARESDIETVHNLWIRFQKRKDHKYDEFFNVCLYSSIVGRDISILWNNYSLTETYSQKNLYGRLLSMTLIEFLDDINGLLGKKLRLELKKNSMNRFVEDLNKINKEFAAVKKQHNLELRKIRNNCSAHKTKKAIDLIDFTKKTHFENLHEISADTSKINIKLTQLTTKIIYGINDEQKVKLAELQLKLEGMKKNSIHYIM
ncbi:hypothetical protein MBM09_10620 [Flaviramulus sp. BrNp1-15]|uniref:hypothetical protein n=1 Tax=Flaviramulus sp. BrNp1-15 TaxID=2916754 RepID=UPI001EE7C781|nr:hypothetical protein [Flaviramulus sp. BrNp1-15]ULC58375.1 hypothetical protein MBM09_10620 [Flaviramulus sp. BrNp1-15]